MEEYKKIGIQVLEARRLKGWTQEELGKRVGVSARVIGTIERGEKPTTLKTTIAIFKTLELEEIKL